MLGYRGMLHLVRGLSFSANIQSVISRIQCDNIYEVLWNDIESDPRPVKQL